jgi:hypothetical protein
MLIVETIAKIRRLFFVQGKPIKAICRELGLSRKVVPILRGKQWSPFPWGQASQFAIKLHAAWITPFLEMLVKKKICRLSHFLREDMTSWPTSKLELSFWK